jgi:hypothetical protein
MEVHAVRGIHLCYFKRLLRELVKRVLKWKRWFFVI